MRFTYKIGIYLYQLLVLVCSVFSRKAKLMVEGHNKIFDLPTSWKNNPYPTIHIHAASLGEFEQARPIIEQIKSSGKEVKIILTFFSPSGYEVRKKYELADYVCYLPFDTPKQAKKFASTFKPSVSIFIKYEFWYNHAHELKKVGTILLSASTILRENQQILKTKIGKRTLRLFDFFFVQNKSTKKLLQQINITQITQTGDTRYDAVISTAKNNKEYQEIKKFIGDHNCIVIGSSWPEDLSVLVSTLLTSNWKIIIAPHEVSEKSLSTTQNIFKNSIRYSKLANHQSEQTLIIDNIGMLTSLYKLATVSYVGGGFKTGLHNILEPAVYGSPVVIGPKFDKFQEVKDLMSLGTCFSIASPKDFSRTFTKLQSNTYREMIRRKNREFIKQQSGAAKKVSEYILEQL